MTSAAISWTTEYEELERNSLNSEDDSNQEGFVHFSDTLKKTNSFMKEFATADRCSYKRYSVGHIAAAAQTQNTKTALFYIWK